MSGAFRCPFDGCPFDGRPFDGNPGCNLSGNLVAGCAAEGYVPRGGVDREDRLAHAGPLHLEPCVVVRGPLRLRVRDRVHEMIELYQVERRRGVDLHDSVPRGSRRMRFGET